jgi:hypothetical protein
MRYKLKLMFEWQSGTIWCDDDAARDELGGDLVIRYEPIG